MAIYRCSFKVFSRSQAHKACAASAYRAGEKIHDDHYGLTHDFTRKKGVEESFILAPDNAPDWMKDRTQLWNGVEAVEKRKDSQLSREVLLSLPHELNSEQRAKLVKEFVQENFVSRGMIADVSLHLPDKKGDNRNHHAHVMLTTRDLMGDGFGKKNRSWNNKEFLEVTREQWAEVQNRTFEKLGLDVRVDHRSLEDQGIDREPEPKLGSFATKAKRSGKPEKASRVIDNFNEVADRNKQRAELYKQAEIIDLALVRLDKAEGDKSKEAGAKHSEEMKALIQRQEQEKRELKEQEQAKIDQAKKEAKARVREALKAERPSVLGRGFEVLTFRGKSAQNKRQEHHEERKESEQQQLNALRKDAREKLKQIEKDQAQARKELNRKQTAERQREERQRKKAEERAERREARKAEREAERNALTPEQREARAIARQEARKAREARNRQHGRGGRERTLGH